MTVYLLLWALPVTFVTGYLFGVREGTKIDGTLEPIPVCETRKPAGPFTRNYLIQIDGEYVRH